MWWVWRWVCRKGQGYVRVGVVVVSWGVVCALGCSYPESDFLLLALLCSPLPCIARAALIHTAGCPAACYFHLVSNQSHSSFWGVWLFALQLFTYPPQPAQLAATHFLLCPPPQPTRHPKTSRTV